MLRYEYRVGESERSIGRLEDRLAKAGISADGCLGDRLRGMVSAHRSLQLVQPYIT